MSFQIKKVMFIYINVHFHYFYIVMCSYFSYVLLSEQERLQLRKQVKHVIIIVRWTECLLSRCLEEFLMIQKIPYKQQYVLLTDLLGFSKITRDSSFRKMDAYL